MTQDGEQKSAGFACGYARTRRRAKEVSASPQSPILLLSPCLRGSTPRRSRRLSVSARELSDRTTGFAGSDPVYPVILSPSSSFNLILSSPFPASPRLSARTVRPPSLAHRLKDGPCTRPRLRFPASDLRLPPSVGHFPSPPSDSKTVDFLLSPAIIGSTAFGVRRTAAGRRSRWEPKG